MGIVKTAVGGLIGGKILGKVFGKKNKAAAPAVPLPQITPRRPSAASEALAGRRGSSANQRTGASGAESTAKGKNRLLGLN